MLTSKWTEINEQTSSLFTSSFYILSPTLQTVWNQSRGRLANGLAETIGNLTRDKLCRNTIDCIDAVPRTKWN